MEERQSPNVFQDIWHTGLYVYSMVLGNVNLEDFFDHPYGFLHEIMFVLFIYIQSILLVRTRRRRQSA